MSELRDDFRDWKDYKSEIKQNSRRCFECMPPNHVGIPMNINFRTRQWSCHYCGHKEKATIDESKKMRKLIYGGESRSGIRRVQ